MKRKNRVITRHFDLGIPKYARKNNCITFGAFHPLFMNIFLLPFCHDFLILLLLFLILFPRFSSFSFIKKCRLCWRKINLVVVFLFVWWKTERCDAILFHPVPYCSFSFFATIYISLSSHHIYYHLYIFQQNTKKGKSNSILFLAWKSSI